MELSDDFREFVEWLDKHEVRFLIVGGYAVAFHGHPRYTKDLDVWIAATQDNAERLLRALHDFGFGSLNLSVADFVEEGMIIQLGDPPNRIDILTSVKGLEFELAWQSREMLSGSELSIPFISKGDLIQAKQSVGRLQDLADIEHLSGPADKDDSNR